MPTPYLKGPVLVDWLKATQGWGEGAVRVQLVLSFYAGLRRSRTFKLGMAQLAEEAGIHRVTASDAVSKLEAADLLHTERRPGCKPVFTLPDPYEDSGE